LPSLWFVLAAPLVAQGPEVPPPTEYEVKAVFLYHFAKFVEWPEVQRPNLEGAFVVTVLGADPFGSLLEQTLEGKKVGGRSMTVRRAARPDDIGPCQILFISDSEKERLPEILQRLGGAAVLTVGEMDRFAERGGVIRFRVERSRIRLDINLAVAERAHLKIRSELLKLARVVGQAGG
jgi:hypothetical protein